MRFLKITTVTIVLGFTSSIASATTLSLVESCAELMEIYVSKNEKSLWAAQTTSLSEGLRAGYCLGVIEQYAKSTANCKADWFKSAEFIATFTQETIPPSDDELLSRSCNG